MNDEIMKITLTVIIWLGILFAMYIIMYVIVLTLDDIRDYINDKKENERKEKREDIQTISIKHDGWYFVQSQSDFSIRMFDDQMRERLTLRAVPHMLTKAEAIEFLTKVRFVYETEE